MDLAGDSAAQARLAVVMRNFSHLGVNAVFLQRGLGGLETYVTSVIPEFVELRPELRITVYVNRQGHDLLSDKPWASHVRLATLPVLGARGLRALTELFALGSIAERDDIDLLHSVAMLGPLRVSRPHVVTVGDLIWMLDRGTIGPLTTLVWGAFVPRVARSADRVLTFSEASRQDLLSHIGLQHDRVDVVPLGPGAQPSEAVPEPELRRRHDLGASPVILCVSAKKPHKNLIRLVRAFAQVRDRFDALLVMPGQPTAHEAELAREAQRLGVRDALRLPPYVDAGELEGLYRLASCFVFPSQREGFGLPVLEAMKRDIPVACASTSALPEVAGEAACYFDPESEGQIAAAITDILSDESFALRLVEAGRRRARLFDWSRTAQETLDSYERAYAERTR
jgi:glycosyltransferase involved in cell wall biosynthesis